MSSPFRRSEHPRSSPSRNRVNGVHRPYRNSQDEAASSQLAEEMSRLYMDDERAFRRALDEQALEQQKLHFESLRKSWARHEQVRREAERTIEQIEVEFERQRVERETEALKKQEEARRRLQEQERKKQEAREAAERQRQEEEAQRVAEQKRKDEDEARRRAEAERRKKEDEDKQARDKAAAEQAATQKAQADAEAERLRQQQAQQSQVNGSLTAPTQSAQQTGSATLANLPKEVVTTPDQRKEVHAAYKAIHQRLKQVRQQVFTLRGQNAQLKTDVDGWRIKIKAVVGQVSKANKQANREGLATIGNILLQSLQRHQQYTVDVSQFFLHNPSPGQPAQGSMLLVFLLNIFVKAVVAQLDQEVAPVYPVDKGESADPIGVMLISLFADPRFQYNGHSLIDICWAKYHIMCPYLFGVPMLEAPKNIKDNGALAAGFAAITLRTFKNHRTQKNPAPNRLFWEALARLTNTPPERQKRAHYVCLGCLVNHVFVVKFISLYGKAAIVALRHALVTFPQTAPQDPAKEVLRQEAHAVARMAGELDSKLHLKL